MNFYNEDDTSSSDNRGKFRDRLKNILKDRLKFRKSRSLTNEDEELVFITFFRNVLKVILVIPSFIFSHASVKEKDIIDREDELLKEDKDLNFVNEELKKIKVRKIKEIDINLLKKKREYFVNKKLNSINLDDSSIMLDMEIKKRELQKEIIDLIKKRLVKNINEYEILQSELYILKEFNLDDIYYTKCQENINEIKRILSRINSIKEKYDYLKDNVDFQFMLEFDDNLLIDKILELKDICSRDELVNIVDDYKLLNEYKYLYLKIDMLQEDAIKIEDARNEKALELKERDIEFEKLKNDIYNIDREKERYDSFVKKQEALLRDLDENLNKIDSYETVSYKLKGFNKLLGNSFKYLGLLLVNPLKGLIPSIATQTVITKNIVHNLYNNLTLEENKITRYETIDYSMSINSAINNLNDMSSLIDSTLEEVVLLKKKYKQEFSKYNESFSSYKDAIKKLNKIENAVLGSKMKIDKIKNKMKENEKINSNKLKRVKKLNSRDN